MKKLIIVLAAGTLVLSVLACAPREHLREDWGRATKARFHKQQVFLEPTRTNPTGLDPEEAAAIQANYRKNMAGGEDISKQPQVLLLETEGKKKK